MINALIQRQPSTLQFSDDDLLKLFDAYLPDLLT